MDTSKKINECRHICMYMYVCMHIRTHTHTHTHTHIYAYMYIDTCTNIRSPAEALSSAHHELCEHTTYKHTRVGGSYVFFVLNWCTALQYYSLSCAYVLTPGTRYMELRIGMHHQLTLVHRTTAASSVSQCASPCPCCILYSHFAVCLSLV